MEPHAEKESEGAAVTVLTEIALNLKAANEDGAERYDASARNLVAQKSVLAYILKSALAEYAGYSVQEIAERFIVGDPEVREAAVHQDHPDRPDHKACAPEGKPGGMMTGDEGDKQGGA